MVFLVEDLELVESQGRDNFDAIVLQSLVGPGCYFGKANDLGWHLSLYLQLFSNDYEEPWWEDWKLSPIGYVDRRSGAGTWSFFAANGVDPNTGLPDIMPPQDFEPRENPDPDRKGYQYFSGTLCQALLTDPDPNADPSDPYSKSGVDKDKLLASPYVGALVVNHASDRKLPANSKFSVLKKSLIDAQFPPASMSGNFQWMVGLNCHWTQQPSPASWNRKGTVLGVQVFHGHEPDKAQQLLGQLANVQPTVVAHQVQGQVQGQVQTFPQVTGLSPSVVAPAITHPPAVAPTFVPPPIAPMAPIAPTSQAVAPQPVAFDVDNWITKTVMTKLVENPDGFAAGLLGTTAIGELQGPEKQAVFQAIANGKRTKELGEVLGMWQVSGDGKKVLPA